MGKESLFMGEQWFRAGFGGRSNRNSAGDLLESTARLSQPCPQNNPRVTGTVEFPRVTSLCISLIYIEMMEKGLGVLN